MKDKRSVWISYRRPDGEGYTSYRQYKEAKRRFQQYRRKCAQNMLLKTLNEKIDHSAEMNSEYFWKLVNKRQSNNNSSNICCEIKFEKSAYRDPEISGAFILDLSISSLSGCW